MKEEREYHIFFLNLIIPCGLPQVTLMFYMSVIIRPPQADDRIIYFAVYVDSPIESGNDKVFNTPQQAAGKY